MKTFTLEEIEKLLGESMNMNSPLAKRVMSKFNGDTPNKAAEKILRDVNKLRLITSGNFHKLDSDVSEALEKLLSEQIDKSYYDDYPLYECRTKKYIFEKGYKIGMGAVDIKKVL